MKKSDCNKKDRKLSEAIRTVSLTKFSQFLAQKTKFYTAANMHFL